MPTHSLSTRLLAFVSVLLVVFFGVAMFALDFAFKDLADRSLRERLEVQLLALISATDEIPGGGLAPSGQLAEARFKTPGSGLYGQISSTDGTVTWRSKSSTGTGLDFATLLPAGTRQFEERRLSDGSQVLGLSMGLAWEFPDGGARNFIYSVAESRDPYYALLNRFRVLLIGGSVGLGLILLLALALLLRWVLTPLRTLEQEIGAVETGERADLSQGYPRELAGVAANLNMLLRTEHERLARYRNTLGNLAHSLKTPLAVMRNVLNAAAQGLPAAQELDAQVSRMDEIVRYQLKRAAASGGSGLGMAPVDVLDQLQQLRSALLKVYAEKDLDVKIEVIPGCKFIGDAGDFTEIAGNLLDNACKWCRTRVQLRAEPLPVPGSRREGLLLVVEDDGPGIPVEQREQVLRRGARLDEHVAGQGIGLSVVRELAELMGGSLAISQSALGGARVEVRLAS